jgi:hypothetical protein
MPRESGASGNLDRGRGKIVNTGSPACAGDDTGEVA